MVMTTCLMVYAALEHTIREQLKAQDEYFPDMKRKPTQTPTARWVDLLTINEQQTLLLNIKDRQSIIIKISGINYQRIYS
jgi:transposase